MSKLIDAMIMHIHHLVHDELTPFSYLDFLKFEVDGHRFQMTHGTFRNNISHLVREGLIEISYKSNITFYTIKGVKFDKASRLAMTGNHTGVASSPVSVSISAPSYSFSSNPLYRILRDLPLDESSVHDIHLRFSSPRIHTTILSLISNKDFDSECTVNSRSKDILLPVWNIKNLLIKAIIHRTDTVSVVVGCSLNPVVLDVTGVIRLTNTLSIIEERLSRLVKGSRKIQGFDAIKGIDGSSLDHRSYHGIIPPHFEWTVTMWHFGADALIEYSGEKFSVTWEIAEDVLIRAYSKVMKDNKTRIRLERQEYPRATLADIIEQKLSPERRFS